MAPQIKYISSYFSERIFAEFSFNFFSFLYLEVKFINFKRKYSYRAWQFIEIN